MIAKIKKIIPYLLLLIAIVGVFGYGKNVEAQETGAQQCYDANGNAISLSVIGSSSLCNPPNTWRDNSIPQEVVVKVIACKQQKEQVSTCLQTLLPMCGTIVPCKNMIVAEMKIAQDAVFNESIKNLGTSTGTSSFEHAVSEQTCVDFGEFSMTACILKVIYVIFYQLGGLLLWMAAILFNFLISYTLDSSFLRSDFISHAWGVVRDLSNIFFILILLYIAIKTVMNMGGHETKSMITSVIIMAVLINFSLFFTKIVIDSSNILALVFYNKTSSIDKNGNKVIDPTTGKPDLAGGLTQSFNPAYKLDANFFANIGKIQGPNGLTTQSEISSVMLIGIALVSGTIMLFAAYALFVSGFSFLGRLIELFILIIFAPFAFMSFAIPKLSHMEFLGWEAWSKRLISVSFMAPIFMFFLYFIFLLLGKEMFTNAITTNNGVLVKLLNLIIPAAVILGLLLKATEFAKKGSGQFGQAVISGAKVAGALAIGAATGGTALAGRAAIGGTAARFSRRENAINDAKYKEWEHGDRTQPAPPRPAALGFRDRIGSIINQAQLKSGDVAHARHEMEDLKKKTGVEGLSNYQLSGVDEDRMKSAFIKEKRYEIESEIKKGYDVKGNEIVTDPNLVESHGIAARGENDYKAQRREEVKREVMRIDPNSMDNAGELNDQGRKRVEDTLTSEFNELLKSMAANVGATRFTHLKNEAKEKVGTGTKILARTTSGTYDPRNLANISADKKAGLGAKAIIGLTAAVAMGIRSGLKGVSGINPGTPKGDIFKDITETVTESLKHVKINVSAGGGDSHKADQGTSGGGHH